MTRSPSSQQRFAGPVTTSIVGWVEPFDGVYPDRCRRIQDTSSKPINRYGLCRGLPTGNDRYRGAAIDPFYFLKSYPQYFVNLWEKK